MIYKKFISIILFSTSLVFFSQESYNCKEFKKGKTQKVDLTFSSITDYKVTKAIANYYRGLKWTYTNNVLSRSKKGVPTLQSGSVKLSRPIAQSNLVLKHFPKSYMNDVKACYKVYRGAFGQRSKPPRNMTKALSEFIAKDNRYFEKITKNCDRATVALMKWNSKVAALTKDMRTYCANQAATATVKNTSTQSNKSPITLTNNKSPSTKPSSKKASTNSSSNSVASTSNNAKPATKKISYKKAKSKVKASKIYPKGNFTPLPSAGASEMQIRQYQQNMKRQWNALNQSERRLSQLFENVFWKNHKAEQAKQERKERTEAKKAKSFHCIILK